MCVVFHTHTFTHVCVAAPEATLQFYSMSFPLDLQGQLIIFSYSSRSIQLCKHCISAATAFSHCVNMHICSILLHFWKWLKLLPGNWDSLIQWPFEICFPSPFLELGMFFIFSKVLAHYCHMYQDTEKFLFTCYPMKSYDTIHEYNQAKYVEQVKRLRESREMVMEGMDGEVKV